jgi:hypothetical protein
MEWDLVVQWAVALVVWDLAVLVDLVLVVLVALAVCGMVVLEDLVLDGLVGIIIGVAQAAY